MLNIHIKRTLYLLLVVASYKFFPILLLILLPGVLLFSLSKLKTDIFDAILFSVVLSFSYWIAAYWLLKFIPIDVNDLVILTITVSSATLVINPNLFTVSHFSRKVLLKFIMLIFFTITYIPILSDVLAPPGADMSTHSYIARVIHDNKFFPKSYEPIAPSNYFGLSPIGMPVLIAITSKIANLPIYTVALVLTVVTYILLTSGLFVLLQLRYSIVTSSIVTLAVMWLGRDLTNYLYWGGIPSLLAISILIYTFTWLQKVIENNLLNNTTIAILALMFSASFMTHHIYAVIVAFYFLPASIAIFYKSISKYLKSHYRQIVLFTGIVLLLNVPFLIDFRYPSSETVDWIKNWQTTDVDRNWRGNIGNAYYTIPFYFLNQAGLPLIIFALIGLSMSFNTKKSNLEKILECCFYVSIILIINSKYWFLPLSELLYPDRVVTIGLLCLCFFAGNFVEFLVEKISVRLKTIKQFRIMALYLIHLCFIVAIITKTGVDNYSSFKKYLVNYSSVSQDDINIFTWISSNTNPSDVISNNYGDSGVWIPAITARKIKTYDAMPYDFQFIQPGAFVLEPDYLFIGSKSIYKNSIFYTYDEYKNNPGFQEVYSSGNAHLFKVINK